MSCDINNLLANFNMLICLFISILCFKQVV